MFYSTVGVCGMHVADARAAFPGSIRAAFAGAAAVIGSVARAGRPRKNGPSETACWIAYRGRRRASLFRTFAPGAGDDAGPGAPHTRPSNQRPLPVSK